MNIDLKDIDNLTVIDPNFQSHAIKIPKYIGHPSTFRATKLKDGYSTCFRQWSAEDTHCKYLHGYGTSVKFTFEGELDSRNWVVDFGGFKRAKHLIDGKSPEKYLKWLLDHTTIIAMDDPFLEEFRAMNELGIIQLRIIPAVGAEKFAEYIYNKFSKWLEEEFENRVRLLSVEFREHEKNSGIYIGQRPIENWVEVYD